MARNKYPEETVKKILDVSFRLFREKGYDHTTIQDITRELGMSKGAIYHHFKSKEDILDHISDRYYGKMDWFNDIRRDGGLNGLEKVRRVLTALLSDPEKLELDRVTVLTALEPRLVDMTLRSTIADAAPFLEELLQEGIRDGSITVRQPKEFSECFMLLMNMWIGMFSGDMDDFMAKLAFLREFCDQLGLPVLDDALVEVCRQYYEYILSVQAQGGRLSGSEPSGSDSLLSGLDSGLSKLDSGLSKLDSKLCDLSKTLNRLNNL